MSSLRAADRLETGCRDERIRGTYVPGNIGSAGTAIEHSQEQAVHRAQAVADAIAKIRRTSYVICSQMRGR